VTLEIESQVRFAVGSIARAVQSDGGDVQLLSYDEETAVVRVGYRLDSACETCVLTPEQLEGLLRDAVERQLPGVDLRLEELAS
jgi:Fe-S cluster biogenesis protein NfuA